MVPSVAVLACLGRANLWFTIPFCLVLSIIAITMVVAPDRLPGKAPQPRWIGRLVGAALLVGLLGFAIPRAWHEARTDPTCELGAAAR